MHRTNFKCSAVAAPSDAAFLCASVMGVTNRPNHEYIPASGRLKDHPLCGGVFARPVALAPEAPRMVVGRREAVAKNMRGELAQARPVTFSVAATAAGTGINQLSAKLVAFQHMAHLSLAITLVWVAPNAIDLK